MTIPAEKEITTAAGASVAHPLDPLTSEEIVRAASVLRAQRQLGTRVRFETIVLKEPEKELVRNFSPGDPINGARFSWPYWTTKLRPPTRPPSPWTRKRSPHGGTSPACSPG